MPYKLELTLKSGDVVISPKIAPNNPCHNYNSYYICNEIVKLAARMIVIERS